MPQSGHRRSLLRPLATGHLIVALGVLLSACLLSADQSIESTPNDPRAQSVTERIRGIDLSPRGVQEAPSSYGGPGQPSRPQIFTSQGVPTQDGASAGGAGAAANGDGFDLNFENAPVTTVAKVVLGDILGVGYAIDPRVQGTVTLSSGRPIAKRDALFVLENALRMSNTALVRDATGYRIIPASEALGAGSAEVGRAEPGYGITVMPLRYVSAQTAFKLLDAFGAKPNTIRAEPGRNLILVQGTGTERASVMDTLLTFDADWMKGQSVGIFPVKNSSPDPIVAEVEKIMDSGENGIGQGVVKLQPIARMNSILVVSKKPEYLRQAGLWISRLDRSDTAGDNLKVYQLRYASARNVVTVLNEVILGRAQSQQGMDSAGSQIAPGSGMSLQTSNDAASRLGMSSRGGDGFGGSGSGGYGGGGVGSGGLGSSSGGGFGGSANSGFGGSTSSGAGNLGSGAAGSGANVVGGGANTPAGIVASRSGGLFGARGNDPMGMGGMGGPNSGPTPTLQNVRITADVANNTVLVYASAENQRIVEQTIRYIDRPQRQVAIEATIAEVTLNDALTYGVQFYLSSKNVGLKPDKGSIVNTIGKAALERVVPGFNLLVGPEAQPNLVLDALHGITDVRVLSNPSLVVLDNQIATLQVGDQVPISTGSATVLTTNNTIVNTIDYRNTGIILRILPRSNANGNIVLDIEQEISNVGSTDQKTLTPTISQRRVKSSIAVNSGQTVLLAGLISDQENKTRSGIPGLDQLPGVLGDAFAHQNIAKKRVELILLIRPTVIRDALDAHVVAEELRSKLSGRILGNSLPVPVLDAPNIRRR